MRKRILLFLAGLILFVSLLFRFNRLIVAWLFHLPAPRYRVQITRALRVPMRDGVTLAADHYQPVTDRSLPTILMRSPYGRQGAHGVFGLALGFFAHVFAERGYHVIVQDTRGRFDSEGEFNPYFCERADGLDTLAWLERQSWFNGSVGLWGPSYLGIVQWAIAAHSPHIRSIMPIVTSSRFRSVVYPDDAFDLGLALRWHTIFRYLDRTRRHPYLNAPTMLWRVERSLQPAVRQLDLAEADVRAAGRVSPYYRQWLQFDHPDDPLWRDIESEISLPKIQAPIHLVAGWYDFFLRSELEDYAALRAAGHRPYLTIGPQHHFSGMLSPLLLNESLRWFAASLNNGHAAAFRQHPVRIFVMGADEWREMDDWPPPARSTRWYLQPGRGLELRPSASDSSFDSYIYDPSSPTPALGGAYFSPTAGRKDNRRLEARPDVLTYTSAPLRQPLEIIGPIRLELYVRSDRDYTDFFGRLCDVYPDGRSINICDGLFRVAPGKCAAASDGVRCVEINLWATAYRFAPGHAVRLQVSSGAHPHWLRNPGTGEPVSAITRLLPARQTIYHDRLHPSALILPVTRG